MLYFLLVFCIFPVARAQAVGLTSPAATGSSTVSMGACKDNVRSGTAQLLLKGGADDVTVSAELKLPAGSETHASVAIPDSGVPKGDAQAKLRPHRLDRYMASNDPEFESKAADIIGLYLNPPQHAAVFCVEEKTAIQALDRLDPVLPLSPGRAERHGFEYDRHGTLSLYAALNVKTGQVAGKTAKRHASADFIMFLSELIGKTKWAREIHIVLDNLSAHKTSAVAEFLEQNPQVRFHFTPTYSSWLNQVQIWFAKIERDVIARGVFTSVWTYTDPRRRFSAK